MHASPLPDDERSCSVPSKGTRIRHLVLGFVYQLVLGDPRHHCTEAGTGFLDRMRGSSFASGLQFGLASAVVEYEILDETT